MRPARPRLRLLLLALVVLVRVTPIAFTLFMFIAQPLFAAALLLLAIGVMEELRAHQDLAGSQSQTSR